MELRGEPRGPEIADEDAGRLLNAVLDGGINLIDTSPDYGRSEELIGRYVGHKRDEFFLASKCGCPIEVPSDTPPPYSHDYSPGKRPRGCRAVAAAAPHGPLGSRPSAHVPEQD
jgi:aryl-alcohol dehydrogenase-like predicted oxidoreductase